MSVTQAVRSRTSREMGIYKWKQESKIENTLSAKKATNKKEAEDEADQVDIILRSSF